MILTGSLQVKRVHLYFRERHRGFVPLWKDCDAFVVYEGTEDILIFPFSIRNMTFGDAEAYLCVDLAEDFGYSTRLAAGRILTSPDEFRFSDPRDADSCRYLVERAVDDEPCFLECFGRHRVTAGDGSNLGVVSAYRRLLRP